jgi:hypothetical protein
MLNPSLKLFTLGTGPETGRTRAEDPEAAMRDELTSDSRSLNGRARSPSCSGKEVANAATKSEISSQHGQVGWIGRSGRSGR